MPTKYLRRIWSGNLHYDLVRPDEQPLTIGNLFAAAALVGLCVGVVMLAQDADDVNAREHERLAKIEQKRLALKGDAATAYEQGLIDGVQSVHGTPDGAALTQACLASGLVVAK